MFNSSGNSMMTPEQHTGKSQKNYLLRAAGIVFLIMVAYTFLACVVLDAGNLCGLPAALIGYPLVIILGLTGLIQKILPKSDLFKSMIFVVIVMFIIIPVLGMLLAP